MSAAVERLLGYEEIRQLVARYAVALNMKDFDTVVSLYVSDVDVGPAGTGREALKAFIADQLRDMATTITLVGTHLIEFVDDDHAHGVVYCRAEFPLDDRWIIQMIQYRDVYERVEGRWHFRKRRHLLWYGADMLTRPIGLEPAGWPDGHVGQGTLPAAWDRFGFVTPGWPGVWGA